MCRAQPSPPPLSAISGRPGDLTGLPESEAAATGRRPFDGLKLALELSGGTAAPGEADAWAEASAALVRPHLIRTASTRDGLESVWRHAQDPPAAWRVPARASALVLHTVAGRLGVDCRLVSLPPSLGLRVEDLESDFVLSVEDGCLTPVEGEHPRPLRPRAVLAAALEAFAAVARPPADAQLRWARVDAALRPDCEAGRVRLAETLLQGGHPGPAYELSARLTRGVLGPEAVDLRQRAEAKLATRN